VSLRSGLGTVPSLSLRTGERQDLVTRGDERWHDGGANETGRAGNEYTHMTPPR
jgi:hypothetical protein